jgi:hypothetical protein
MGMIRVAQDRWGYARVTMRRVLAAEFWQFLVVVVAFVAAAVLWLCVVYLPGRTLERWEDQRPGRGDKKRGGSGPAG